MFPAVAVGGAEQLDESVSKQVLSQLHKACIYGELATVQRLVGSRPSWGWINSGDPKGRRPVHMVLSPQSSPNTSSCLTYLVEHGADVNVTTDSGATPLHLAATEGLLDCTETLLRAGANVLAQDSMGHTPLDLARVWCHRKVARYLKNSMWEARKKNEMHERKLVQTLYSDLVDIVKLKDLNKKSHVEETMAEWAKKKGLPLLKDCSPKVFVTEYHTWCFGSVQESLHPKQPLSRPWTIFMGLLSEESLKEPDLRDKVTVWLDSSSRQPQYTTTWDSTHHPAPDLPLDILERVLFPRAFPSRIASARQFEPHDIVEVQHRRNPQGRSTSPWTEVAMHLAEVLEPGHY